MRIAICDDEQQQREKVQKYIELFPNECLDIIVQQFSCGEDLLKAYQDNINYDIVFLDISMKKVDGIKAAEIIHKISDFTIIVFISSYVQFVSEAFRQHAFQFLIKPITQDDFNKEFERVINQYYTQHQKYIIKIKNNTITLEIKDIAYIEGYQHHLYIVTKEKEQYMIVGKLNDKEKQLIPLGFVRVHQGFLVNMGYIKSINDKDILTTTGVLVEMSSRKRSYVLSQYHRYLVGQIL